MDEISNLVELSHELAGAIRGLNEVLVEMRNESRHSTADTLTNRLGQFVNGTLYSGGVKLDSKGFKRFTYRGPYASVSISDPNNVGPLLISTGALSSSEGATATAVGPGYWRLPQGASMTVPLSGHELDIYGAPSGVVFLVVYTEPQQFSFAPGPASGTSVPAATSTGPVSVAAGLASAVLQAANASRKGLLVVNTDTASNLFLTLGATSSTALYTVKLVPGAYWEAPGPAMYTGVVSGIWDGAPTGAAMVTELA